MGHCYADTLKLAEKQLTDYGVDYVDSIVLHFPPLAVVAAGGCPGQLLCPMIRNQWKAMVEFYKAGKARALGVSNYCKNCYHNCLVEGNFDVMPHIHQISYHLGMGKDSQGFVTHAKENNMTIQAYSTLANKPEWYFWEPKGMNPRILSGDAFDGALGFIAKRHNKTTAQVALKWVVQKGFTALTKSGNPKHLAQDSDIYDFGLNEGDLKTLDQEVPDWPKSHADHGLHGMPAWACHPPVSPMLTV
jgi:diketogulonate reductase-like aldo/keto reductase